MTKAREVKVQPKRTRPTTPTNPTTGSFQVSDALWKELAHLLPQRVNTHPLGGGRPRVPDRTCANGIFYVLRTGRQWKALDHTGICSASSMDQVLVCQLDVPVKKPLASWPLAPPRMKIFSIG